MKQVESARFQFVNFVVQESHIVLRERGEYEFKFEFEPSGVVYPALDQFELHLGLKIREKGERVEINLKTISIFEFDKKDGVGDNPFFVTNAPAIVFPYIRAYIANLTAQSGIGTITMPTLNMQYLADELKKNIEIKE